jgi:hypothetical protein
MPSCPTYKFTATFRSRGERCAACIPDTSSVNVACKNDGWQFCILCACVCVFFNFTCRLICRLQKEGLFLLTVANRVQLLNCNRGVKKTLVGSGGWVVKVLAKCSMSQLCQFLTLSLLRAEQVVPIFLLYVSCQHTISILKRHFSSLQMAQVLPFNDIVKNQTN